MTPNTSKIDPLIGMSLLRGYGLQIDTTECGLVVISELYNFIFCGNNRRAC
jgi:hypothetical protein